MSKCRNPIGFLLFTVEDVAGHSILNPILLLNHSLNWFDLTIWRTGTFGECLLYIRHRQRPLGEVCGIYYDACCRLSWLRVSPTSSSFWSLQLVSLAVSATKQWSVFFFDNSAIMQRHQRFVVAKYRSYCFSTIIGHYYTLCFTKPLWFFLLVREITTICIANKWLLTSSWLYMCFSMTLIKTIVGCSLLKKSISYSSLMQNIKSYLTY